MESETGALDAILMGKLERGCDFSTLDEETTDILVFQIDQAWYAFPGSCIREILSQGEIFFVPGCIPSMEGVINVRGDIESVINLSDILGLKSTPYVAGGVILLGKAAGMQSGIRVDKVIDVLPMVKSAFQPSPTTLPEKLQPMVSSLVMYKNVPVALLSLENIFEDYSRRLG